jgi:hypothetical protein
MASALMPSRIRINATTFAYPNLPGNPDSTQPKSALVAGKVPPKSRNLYREIITRLIGEGAQAIILGCTEIMLLVSDEDSAVPLFDTTAIHAIAAVDRALRQMATPAPLPLP